MVVITLVVEIITISMLYNTAFNEQRARLVETAKSQARLIEAVARFDRMYNANYPEGAHKATLSQIIDAHNNYKGFGETGEFTLSKKEGDKIVFLLSHRHYDRQNPKPVPLESELAAPMRRALAGKSGTIVGLDYRGVVVLAAHEPVEELDWGIVAKIDLSEIRAPFIKTIVISCIIGLIMIIIGSIVFIGITNPLIQRLSDTVKRLQDALDNVKTLSGLLPICSSCKKIRDDKGYWNQIESYVREHSDADFSHSICPECARKLYPEIYEKAIETE
jgi:hypothetical protein